MGTPFYYSMWQPIAYNNSPAVVYPTYASLLFMADLIADIPSPAILELSAFESDTMAVYAIYDGGQVSKLVVLNLDYYNDTTAARPSQTVDVTQLLGHNIKVSRLTGVLTTTTDFEDVTWAGQKYSSGQASGERVAEYYGSGVVKLAASEAVIIQRN